MSEATVQTIAQTNQNMYDRLLVSIEAGIGLLQIFIAVCDADRQREQIISNYERELAPNFQTYRVYLDRQEPSLRHAIASVVTSKENAIAMVLGAETLGLSSQQDESLKKFFGYLQWTREALRELKLPIVLWVPSRIFDRLAKQSPDFWSWRNGVFQFQPEPSLITTELIDFQPINFARDEQPNSVLSVEQLEASLTKAIATAGVDSRNLETLYSQLGTLYSQRVRSGKSVDREHELALAQDYLDRAIVLQTKFQSEQALAVSLNSLALLYQSQGRYSEAEPLFLRSLEIRERQLGADHSDLATSLNNLAAIYQAQGHYDKAEPLFLRSLEIMERQLGTDHPDLATSLNNLGFLYQYQGRYSEAEPLYLRSLEIRERQLGADHSDLATSLNNLGILHKSQGRYSEAETLYLRSLDIWERQLGADHPNLAQSLNNLAALYQFQRHYDKAEPLFLRSLEISERQLDANHPDLATSLNNLAVLYQEQGYYDKAEPLYKKALQICEQSLGAGHPNTMTIRANYARCLRHEK
jgi:tetratricopeptide (TPR) repeat protein